MQQLQQIDRTPVFKAAVAKYGPTMGLTMPEAQQIYQQMVAEGAKKGQDLNQLSNAKLWMLVENIVEHPKMQQVAKQAQSGPQGAPQPVTGAMLHMATGGELEGGESAVVGDDPGGGQDNSEVVQNPAGNAPVQVNPSGNNLTDAISQGHQQGIQQAATVVANVLGISPAAVMKNYTPDQIAQAYAQFDAKIKAAAPGNSASGLFAALGQYSNPNSMSQHDKEVAVQRSNIADDTIGKTLQEQKSLGEGVTAATGVQNANQSAQQNDLSVQAKTIENKNAGLGSDLLTQKNDAKSNISVGVRSALKGIGISLPDSYSAAQAELITAGNAQAQKVIDDAMTAGSVRISANASATQAGTAAHKEEFGEGLVNKQPGAYVWNGGEATLAPGQSTAQTQFADRKAKADSNIPQLEKSLDAYGDALKTGMNGAVKFGKYSPTQIADLQIKDGPTYNAEQKFQALSTENLANIVSTVGGSAELRVAGVDNSALKQVPTVTESKEAAMNKIVKKIDQNVRLQDVSHNLHNYSGPLDGSQFSTDNTGKIAVWNPNTNQTAMIQRDNLKTAEAQGMFNVSDGYSGFLSSISRGKK